jgi:4-amino-4-deoxy-L-arabinose transferase-like glycosyltransferase
MNTKPSTTASGTLSKWLFGGFSLGWLVLWFAGLGSRPLGEPDEGRYAEVAREMFASGNWLTPKLDGFNFFDKPALQYWATSIFYTVFGVHEWTARLWVALTGMLAIAVAGWAAKRLYGARTGWTTVLVLGSGLLFMAGGHINTIDMGVAAFLGVGICLFLVSQFDPSAEPLRTRLNLLGWASLALAVLSKGLIGVVLPAAALFVFMLWERDWSILRRMTMGWGLLLLLVITAPWFVAISLRHADFFDYFFIREHFSRFLTSVDGRDQPWWFFPVVVALGLFPWTVFLPFSRSSWRTVHDGASASRFLLCWVGVVVVFFSISHSKLPFYILPVFPALAILLAKSISQLPMKALVWRFMAVALLAAVVVVAVLLQPAGSGYFARHTDMHGVLLKLALGFGVLTAAASLGGLMIVFWRRALAAVGLLGFASLFVWQMLFANLGSVANDLSAAPAAKLMQPYLQADTEVFTVHAYLRGLSFYLQRLVTVVDDSPDDITPGRLSRPDGYVPHIADFEARWRAAPSALAVVDTRLLPQLQADKLPMVVLGTLPKRTVIRRPPATDTKNP